MPVSTAQPEPRLEGIGASRGLSVLDGVLTGALASLACALLALGLASGSVGQSQDSWSYRDAASHLAKGEGMVTSDGSQVRTVTRWPPGYPMLLACGELLGLGIDRWAKAINFALLGILIAGTYLLLRAFELGRPDAVMGALLLLLGNGVLVQFGMLLSEALFLPLEIMFIGALMLGRHRKSTGWILVAAFIAAAATLTRFAGEGLILGGICFCLFDPGVNRGYRLRSAALFFLAAQAPVAAWLARNWLLTGAVSDLGFAPRAPDGEAVFNLWRVFTTFWLPEGLYRWFRHGIAALLLALALLHRSWPMHGNENDPPLVRASTWTILGYIVFLLWTYFSSVSLPHLDLRMMLPVLLPLSLILATSSRDPRPAFRSAARLLLVVLLAIGAIRSISAVEAMGTVGPYAAWLNHGAAP